MHRLLRARASRLRTDEGFTLPEMLVALLIITSGLFALLGGFVTAAASIQAQQEDARAVRVALDRYEALRLRDWTNDADLTVGTHTGQARGSNGTLYSYTTTITLRDTNPSAEVPGDLVKDLSTVVTWVGRNGRTRQITYRTSIAQDPGSLGVRSGYIQAIKNVVVAPEPSVVVDYDGYTNEPVYVTIEMSGFATADTVSVGWVDGNGTRTGTATSTDGRYWRLTIPAGSTGIRILNPQANVASTLTFTVSNRLGQTATDTLLVYGPVNNPPVINSFTVTPNPIRVYNGGQNKDKNQADVTFTCDVSGLDPGTNSTDRVTVDYYEDSGPVSVTLSRTTGTLYQKTFLRDTTRFAVSTDSIYTCKVRRGSDGGPASKSIHIQVGRA